MRIVQITDLHFGNGKHNIHLMAELKQQLEKAPPDLIIVTGDLVSEPLLEYFTEAKTFLTDLALVCKNPPDGDLNRPRLIVVPGNHDIFPGGFGFRFPGKLFRGAADYRKVFADYATQYFYQPENVWVFGFDSATKGRYAGGNIRPDELDLFHKSYNDLNKTYGRAFRNAFKIAVLHHHPIPVNWDSNWKHRWLTLLNSGSFLGAVLHRRVDLVLHGHEHLQAHARLSSTLGGDEGNEMLIVSLGSTLRSVANPDHNWFNVITVEPHGNVKIESYRSQGQFAYADTAVADIIVSSAAARKRHFLELTRDTGSYYRNLASITKLSLDGDARRILECQLTILNADSHRSRRRELELPYTSGDIQLLEVRGGSRSGLASIAIAEEELPTPTQRNHVFKTVIDFGKSLAVGESVNYQYSWWAVDGFAMDEDQFDYKYADRTKVEFTHFVIQDPVENLLLMVQFPEGFVPSDGPEIRVSRRNPLHSSPRDWERDGLVEKELVDEDALRYVESLCVASLRVSRPQVGLSYGIQWRVPRSPPRKESKRRQQIMQVVELLLKERTDSSGARSKLLLALLFRMAHSVREILLAFTTDEEVRQWRKPLEISLLIFDVTIKQLVAIRAANFIRTDDKEQLKGEVDHRDITFDYGDGVGGRAFKTNDYRLYVRSPDRQRAPIYHRPLAGHADPWVTLAVPIRVPSEGDRPYGVLRLTSELSDCPLASLGESNSPVTGDDWLAFTEEMNDLIFSELTGMSLGKN